MTELTAVEHIAHGTERQGPHRLLHGRHGTVKDLGPLHSHERTEAGSQQAG